MEDWKWTEKERSLLYMPAVWDYIDNKDMDGLMEYIEKSFDKEIKSEKQKSLKEGEEKEHLKSNLALILDQKKEAKIEAYNKAKSIIGAYWSTEMMLDKIDDLISELEKGNE